MFHCVVSFVYHFLNFDLIFFILPDFKKGILEFNFYDLGIRDFEQFIFPWTADSFRHTSKSQDGSF